MKEEVQTELVSLYQQHGALNPEAVVDAARDKKSALHTHFDWDNSEAAHKYRLLQARNLIRVAVTVIPALSNEPVKQFVSIRALRGSDQGSYIATTDLLSDDDKYELAKADAIRSLERIKYQYNYIAELQPVWAAIDKVLVQVKKRRAA